MAAVTVSDDPASEIYAADDSGSANILEGIIIHNAHATAILYVAIYREGVDAADATQAEVTVANGVPIDAGTSLGFDLRVGDSIRGISDTDATGVRIAVLKGG